MVGNSAMRAMADPFHDRAVVSPEPYVVTIWSDIGCPWATLALHTLRSRAEERDVDILIDHRAFPLELFNERPTPKEIIDVEVTAIAGLVPSLGWRPWSRPASEYVVSTLPAMAAVQAAKAPEVGGLRASEELDSALRQAFYTQSRCISVQAQILRAAAACPAVSVPELQAAVERGAGYSEVFAQWRTARELPVQGSPHVFVRDAYAEHNPGVEYHWTAKPGEGFPRLERYDSHWADVVIDVART